MSDKPDYHFKGDACKWTGEIQRDHAFNLAVAKVQQQTQDNDHTGAIVTMAAYAARQGHKNLVDAAQAVESLHAFYGHMPSHLNQIRDEVAARIEAMLNPDERKAFHNAR